MRVEPAFGRNVDLMTGGQLAEWRVANGKAAICLTETGKEVAKKLENDDGSFVAEKEFLQEFSSRITEGFVTKILLANRAPS